ncbi:TRAP transporter small permease [Pleomorphochaeta sp. DL1XJH-081]|uniref:TRAP transporter small permease n=1 Tax=Pleomorphochaeta sp. DL1XJH-081 TaxID=3409690 RepID=UPI003BB649E0
MDSQENKAIGMLYRISDILNKIVSQLCVITIGGMTFVVLLGVLFRYVFRIPLSWSEELSRYLMIWAAALAISIGIRENEHVGLTILLDGAKSKVMRMILGSIIFVVVLGFLLIMIYYSIQMTIEAKFQISMGLGITMVLPSLAIPVSMILAVIQLVLTHIINLSRGYAPESHEKKIIDI